MSHRFHQQGATLIVILGLLLLIMIIGTLAMRNSMTSLNIATNAQAQQLLFQNNDAALFNLENPDFNQNRFNQAAIFGTFLGTDSAVQSTNRILVSCFNGNLADSFSITSEILINENTLNSQGTRGYCTSTSFSTSRSALISQIYIQVSKTDTPNLRNPRLIDNGQIDYLKNQNKGTSQEKSIAAPVPLGITTISIIPGLSSATSDQINKCFLNQAKQAVDCFQSLNIPYNVQYADYLAGRSIDSI